MKLINQEALYTSFEAESRSDWGVRISEALGPEIDPTIKELCVGSRPQHSYPKWQQTFKIGEYFEVNSTDSKEVKQLNTQLLSALSGGVEHLYLRVNASLDSSHLKQIFDGVILDYIQITLFTDQEALSIPEKWAKDHYTIIKNNKSRSLSLSIDSSLTPAEGIANVIKQIGAEMPLYSEQRQFFVSTAVGDSYLAEIARLRALHHTFNLLNSEQGWKHQLVPVVSYAQTNATLGDYQKIATTARGLAAILGGAGVIIPFGLEPAEIEEVRIARNQLHLLRLESYIDTVQDPLAGSHTVEYATDLIAREVWDRVSKSDIA